MKEFVMLTPLDPIFRLRSWTIRKHKGRFHITSEDHPTNWGKSYISLTRACNAIARKLEAEWTERAKRYEAR